MSLLPAHRRSLLADFNDLWNAFAPTGVAPMWSPHLLRVEDSVDDGHYVVRAEIPGVDPVKDVQVSVQDRHLVIKAERTETKEEKGRSEFSYGSFYRAVTLPARAREEGIEASYSQGILTVRVPMAEPAAPAKQIEIKAAE